MPAGLIFHEGYAVSLGRVSMMTVGFPFVRLARSTAASMASMSLPGMDKTFQPKEAHRSSALSWPMTSSVVPESEAIAVDKDREVIKAILRTCHSPFPNRTFITFTVT